MTNRLTESQLGVLYMVVASFLFALTMVFAKLLSSSMGAAEITFWRNSIGILVIGAGLFGKPIINRGGKPFLLFFRGFIGTMALLAFFYTIGVATLSSAIIYAKTEPIFTAILAFFLLKERLALQGYIAIFVGFAGVVLLSGSEWSLIHTMGILVGFLSAIAYVSVRSLKPYYDPRTVVLSFMASGTLIPLVLLLFWEYFAFFPLPNFVHPFVIPSLIDWVWIVCMGIAAAYGQIFMTRGYFYAKAGIVSTASYSVVLFATIFGILLGDPLPTLLMMIGAILVIISGVMLTNTK